MGVHTVTNLIPKGDTQYAQFPGVCISAPPSAQGTTHVCKRTLHHAPPQKADDVRVQHELGQLTYS